MKLLVLGGTKFLGRALVEQALGRGHDVTLFTRGRTHPDLFPEAEHLIGDRDGRLGPLQDRRWDAVVDTSGYVPRVVGASAELLAGCVGRYCFVSSVSVYAGLSDPVDESSPVATLADPTVEEMGPEYENYGGLKALCEDVVRDVFGQRGVVVRPGLIVGPHDPSGRFTYWAHRLRRGGEVLAPGPPERTVQFVDVRDLAAWLLDLLEAGRAGTYNAVNPGVAWAELLAGGEITWVPDAFLVERGVGEWMELPLWLADPEWVGMHMTDVSKATSAGLRFRPLAETLAGAAEAPLVDGVGLSPEREAELLAAWHAR